MVAVVGAKGVVFLKGYGVRQTGAAEAVDENTRFQIASMSKFVTSTAVATLVDRGIVGWDIPVSTFSRDNISCATG